MAIDFDIEPEFQEQIDWVEKFTKEEIEPLDNFLRAPKMKNQKIIRLIWIEVLNICPELQLAALP